MSNCNKCDEISMSMLQIAFLRSMQNAVYRVKIEAKICRLLCAHFFILWRNPVLYNDLYLFLWEQTFNYLIQTCTCKQIMLQQRNQGSPNIRNPHFWVCLVPHPTHIYQSHTSVMYAHIRWDICQKKGNLCLFLTS